jgi:Protein of unknown function (DUF3455)
LEGRLYANWSADHGFAPVPAAQAIVGAYLASHDKKLWHPGKTMKTLALLLGARIAVAPTLGLAASPATQYTALEFTGRGTQIYICQNTDSAYAWVLKGPDTQLFNAAGEAVGRHFFGPQWEANDGSRIAGQLLVASASPDGGQENVPWLVLRAHVEQAGGIFGHVRIITRTDTHGGAAPTAPCGPQQDGQIMSVVYSATYAFFSRPEGTASGT